MNKFIEGGKARSITSLSIFIDLAWSYPLINRAALRQTEESEEQLQRRPS